MFLLEDHIHQLNDILTYKIFGLPFILIWLLSTSIFLTFKLKFINFRLFKDAVKTILYVDKDPSRNKDKNAIQISPFTAFATQASGNLGLGNIAGAAFAVATGGPGVLFWIFLSSFFFSIIKFSEITLGHKYRVINKEGVISGGAFYFIRDGFAKKTIFGFSLKKTGIFLGIVSAVLTTIVIFSWSFFQLNQIVAIMTNGQLAIVSGNLNYEVIGYSLLISVITSFVLIGGIKRLGKVADTIMPIMAGGYLLICIYIINFYSKNIIATFDLIFKEAFSSGGMFGGFSIILIIAMQRMMFATESGAGTAAMVHANSSIKRSSHQGLVAIVDCVLIATIICFGGFTILVSGIDYQNSQKVGIVLMDAVFSGVNPYFHYILIVISLLFGFTTITSNGYSIQKSIGYLFGTKKEGMFLYIFVFLMFCMSFYESAFLVKIFDILTLLMLIPNTIGVLVLSNEVVKDLNEYFKEKKL